MLNLFREIFNDVNNSNLFYWIICFEKILHIFIIELWARLRTKSILRLNIIFVSKIKDNALRRSIFSAIKRRQS